MDTVCVVEEDGPSWAPLEVSTWGISGHFGASSRQESASPPASFDGRETADRGADARSWCVGGPCGAGARGECQPGVCVAAVVSQRIAVRKRTRGHAYFAVSDFRCAREPNDGGHW